MRTRHRGEATLSILFAIWMLTYVGLVVIDHATNNPKKAEVPAQEQVAVVEAE